MFRFTHDDEDGILEVRIEGSLPMALFLSYAQMFRTHVREARMCGRPLRLMIDMRGAATLPADVAERMARLEQELITSALDRVATIVMSNQRGLSSRRGQSFTQSDDARRWLLAFAHNPMRRAA